MGHDESQGHLEEQLHQLSSKVENVLVLSGLHPVIRMRKLDPHSRSGDKNPGIRATGATEDFCASHTQSTGRVSSSDNKSPTSLAARNLALPRLSDGHWIGMATSPVGTLWCDHSARHSRGKQRRDRQMVVLVGQY